MHRRFGQFACWPPNTPLALGDVGVLRRDRFDKATTLADLGIRSLPDETGTPTLLEYSSADEVRLVIDGEARAAAVLPPLEAKISISFARGGATFFQAAGAVKQSITNLPKLERELRPLLARKIWRPEWAVVTSVQRTGPTIILVSDRRDAKVEFSVSADTLGPSIPLAAAAAGIEFGSMHGVGVRVVAPEGTTPLFGAAQFRGRNRTLTYRTGGVELAELGWDDVDAGE
ncbi:hypothetical protein [Kribbella sp. NPDC000426]|uniref:hypothetical protein n=1 Tax=Kribbella sp. NPDC000426 TaxID=3154255 RepID=UPI00332C0578